MIFHIVYISPAIQLYVVNIFACISSLTIAWMSSLASAEFQNLRVVEHLEAKRAHIEHLSFVVSNAGAKKADIGYHFKLKDPDVCGDFDEGDVVGFYKDDSGTASIQLLNNKNGKEAFMAGVISRSAYLEATPPMDEDGLFYTICPCALSVWKNYLRETDYLVKKRLCL